MNYRWKILSGLRFRYLLASLVFLLVILIAVGYYSIKAGQNVTLDSLIEQGKALTTVLTASASNIIETDRQVKEMSVDRLMSDIRVFKLTHAGKIDRDYLQAMQEQVHLARAAVLDQNLNMLHEFRAEPRNRSAELDSLGQYFLANIKPEKEFDVIFDFYAAGESWFLQALIPFSDSTYLMIVRPWFAADRGVSLPYLLNQLSQEAGIEYIMLQNPDGIVFASKQISQTDRIADDPFLAKALEADTACSRVIDFQDRSILEVVQKFDSGEQFSGLFRVGLSLYVYRQLSVNFQKQIWFFVIMLLALGIIGAIIVYSYQNMGIAEEALSRANAITRSLQDSIAGIIISTDENLKIVTANTEARWQFGLPEGGTQGLDYNNYFPDDPFKVKAVLHDKRPVSFETQIKGKAGLMQMLVSTSILHGAKGQPTGVIVVAHDISEKRSLERQAQQSQRLSELGTVAAGLAHDIRNPLNAIGMVIQRLAGEVEVKGDRSEFDDFIKTLKAEHIKLNATIEKILQVARSSRMEMKDTPIKPVIEDVIALYRYEAADHRIEIISDIENGNCSINELSFKNIISNLLKNAIEAIKENGHIEISGHFTAEKLFIKVTDSGPGIPQERLVNLFKPFYTTKVGGTGLGLATAYKSAIDHGGDLKVESKSGGPTIFTLTIPMKR